MQKEGDPHDIVLQEKVFEKSLNSSGSPNPHKLL